MIVASRLVFLFGALATLIDANEEYPVGIVNHNTTWYIHCPYNNTQIIKPSNKEQPLIPYQCSYPSLPINIVPIEVDFTCVCRTQSRLIWIIVDLYQYNLWFWLIDIEQLNITIKLNEKVRIDDFKRQVTNYTNRFIIINAFYIPFESLEALLNERVDVFVTINQCSFRVSDDAIWKDVMHRGCNSLEHKTFQFQQSHCDFYPKPISTESNHELNVHVVSDSTASVSDFNVILSIDERHRMESTTYFPKYHLLFEENYRSILETIAIVARASSLATYILIFTSTTLILLIIFFLYTLCYHHRIRSIRRPSL